MSTFHSGGSAQDVEGQVSKKGKVQDGTRGKVVWWKNPKYFGILICLVVAAIVVAVVMAIQGGKKEAPAPSTAGTDMSSTKHQNSAFRGDNSTGDFSSAGSKEWVVPEECKDLPEDKPLPPHCIDCNNVPEGVKVPPHCIDCNNIPEGLQVPPHCIDCDNVPEGTPVPPHCKHELKGNSLKGKSKGVKGITEKGPVPKGQSMKLKGVKGTVTKEEKPGPKGQGPLPKGEGPETVPKGENSSQWQGAAPKGQGSVEKSTQGQGAALKGQGNALKGQGSTPKGQGPAPKQGVQPQNVEGSDNPSESKLPPGRFMKVPGDD